MNWMLYLASGLYLFGGNKRPIFLAGCFASMAYLFMRGTALGRLPLIGPHDTLAFFSGCIVLMGLPFLLSPAVKGQGWFSWGVGFLAASFALMASPFPSFNMPLPPVLNTFWFELHVALAFFAYALFGIAALCGTKFLTSGERPILDLQYKAALVGYSFFSASMVSGGIWGYYAWGTYWLWTPKELWTSILWLFYSFYLHLRLKGPTWERAVAWAGIIGFVVALFTYLGVSMLMKSSHSF